MSKLPVLYVMASLTLIIVALYLAKAVLIPVALASLLAFLLNPIVTALQRRGLGRIPAVILVVVFAFSLIGTIGWTVFMQFVALTDDLPQYQTNIKQKITDLRGAGEGLIFGRIHTVIEEIGTELQRDQKTPASAERPVPVVVQAPSVLWQLPILAEPLATAGLVIALVIFMLLDRGDLRNRLIRLVGYGRLTLTTKALEEAAWRISRYLLMHLIINGTYGIALGVALFYIGVPYAILWGVLAALLRFIPYVGPAISALFPTLLSLAAFPGWERPLLVIGLIVLLELTSNMIMEPLLYGRTAGISEVALMIAIAFWTWLWGPVGLLLATPLTVSLGVLGRYVPQLEFLGVLLSDEPALEPHTSYYQRLVARDEDDAAELVEEYLQSHPLVELYDAVLVPALYAAGKDHAYGNLTADDWQSIVQSTREIVENIGEHLPPNSVAQVAETIRPELPNGPSLLPKVQLVCCPARNEADEVALLMLQQLLDPVRFEVELLPSSMLTAEVVALTEQKQVRLLCLGTLAPGGIAQARYLCKRLHAQLPALNIVVGRWGVPQPPNTSWDVLRAAGANAIGTTLQETCAQIMQFEPLTHPATPAAANSSTTGLCG
jgi:predicted PurR-regulated permease PerM